GILALNGTNTYRGGTRLLAGGTKIKHSASLGASTGGVAIGTAALDATATFSTAQTFTLTSTAAVIDVEPGRTLTLTGAVIGGASSYAAQIGGATPGNAATNYGQTNASGRVALGSGTTTLTVTRVGGYTPAAGGTFVLINGGGGVTGFFRGLAEGATFSTNFL